MHLLESASVHCHGQMMRVKTKNWEGIWEGFFFFFFFIIHILYLFFFISMNQSKGK